jgi:hypothetical protein
MMMNIIFNYRYCDSGNYKNNNFLVFSNPQKLSLAEIESAIKSKLIDGEYFYHTQFNVPAIFTEYVNPHDDPSWHEFVGVEETEECPTHHVSIQEFIQLISKGHHASLITNNGYF